MACVAEEALDPERHLGHAILAYVADPSHFTTARLQRALYRARMRSVMAGIHTAASLDICDTLLDVEAEAERDGRPGVEDARYILLHAARDMQDAGAAARRVALLESALALRRGAHPMRLREPEERLYGVHPQTMVVPRLTTIVPLASLHVRGSQIDLHNSLREGSVEWERHSGPHPTPSRAAAAGSAGSVHA